MAETSSSSSSPTEELVRLIKRLGAYVTFKMSSLFSTSLRNLDPRSVGAIAGLAIAIIFTWRAVRTPGEPQRRQPKRSVTPTAGNASAVTQSNIAPTRIQNVPDLGQIVRHKLSGGRKVTCRLLGVILEETTPEELQKQATVRSSVLEVLVEITKSCDLYLMDYVLDDESEIKVLQALESAGVFTSGGLDKDKVLFCSTEMGRASFVRQLEPDWHIDTNTEILTQLARFIKYQLHVSPVKPERTAPNIFSSPSVEHFFGSF